MPDGSFSPFASATGAADARAEQPRRIEIRDLNARGVYVCARSLRRAWTAYASAHPQAGPFHRVEWADLIAERCGADAYYRMAWSVGADGPRLAGVLPLHHLEGPGLGALGGGRLISCAFAEGGGLLADDAETAEALLADALALGRRLGARSIELRAVAAAAAGWSVRRADWRAFRGPLSAALDDPTERCETGGRRIRFEHDPERFHALARRDAHRRGAPALGIGFWRGVADAFGDAARFATLETADGRTRAGLVALRHNRTTVQWRLATAGTDVEAAALRRAAMARAVEEGCERVDLGVARDGSAAAAERAGWGLETSAQPTQFAWLRGAPPPGPDAPLGALWAPFWRGAPQALVDIVGPALARRRG